MATGWPKGRGERHLAWVEFYTRQIRFLRATGDPTVAGNWKNSQGTSTTPDSLGTARLGRRAEPGAYASGGAPRSER